MTGKIKVAEKEYRHVIYTDSIKQIEIVLLNTIQYNAAYVMFELIHKGKFVSKHYELSLALEECEELGIIKNIKYDI